MIDPSQPASSPVPPRVWHEPARYRPQELRKYRGNAFIEALPPIRSVEEAADLMAVYPDYDPGDRELPAHLRLHQISEVMGLVQPLAEHNDLQVRLSRMLRDGYQRRDPLDPAFEQQGLAIEHAIRVGLAACGGHAGGGHAGGGHAGGGHAGGGHAGGAPAPAGGFADRYTPAEAQPERQEEFQVDRRARAHATAMVLLGISGVGKSTALERIFALYPQVIVHREYNGRPLPRLQIVWLKLECPHDGSLRGLCVNFFHEVDAILGTNYLAVLVGPRDTAETLLPKMARVAWQHGIGLFTIDEIQHLSQAKSGGEAKMLNFFVTLVNQIGLPVLLVGTYKASKILAGEFRQARRGAGQGDFVWDPMTNVAEKPEDEEKVREWEMFVGAVTAYEYTRADSPRTPELLQTLFDESQGITVLVVLLWMLAQERAIVSGTEVVTSETIESVAKDRLRLLRPLLQALRVKDETALRQLGDVLPDVVRANVEASRRAGSLLAGSLLARRPRPAPAPACALPASERPRAAPESAAPSTGAEPADPAARTPAPRKSKARRSPRDRAPEGTLARLVTDAEQEGASAYDALRSGGFTCDVVRIADLGGGDAPTASAPLDPAPAERAA